MLSHAANQIKGRLDKAHNELRRELPCAASPWRAGPNERHFPRNEWKLPRTVLQNERFLKTIGFHRGAKGIPKSVISDIYLSNPNMVWPFSALAS